VVRVLLRLFAIFSLILFFSPLFQKAEWIRQKVSRVFAVNSSKKLYSSFQLQQKSEPRELAMKVVFLGLLTSGVVSAFVGSPLRPMPTFFSSSSARQVFGFSEADNNVIDELMESKGLSREEAERDYKAFKMNPNDYALQKGEAYYRSLGYEKLMDGVIGEAEKEGRGEEVRQRIAEFKRKSKIKGLSVIGIGSAVFFGLKFYSESDPAGFAKLMGN